MNDSIIFCEFMKWKQNSINSRVITCTFYTKLFYYFHIQKIVKYILCAAPIK